MRKILVLFFFLLACFCLRAEVGFITVTDEDKHSRKEDFYHTFEYHIIPEKGGDSKCQATRIGRQWFVTAAHCVYERCVQQKCSLRLDLLEGDISVFVTVDHSKQDKHVFIHPDYNPRIFAKNDFALLKINPLQGNWLYVKRLSDKVLMPIPQKIFEDAVSKSLSARRAYRKVISPSFPPVLFFEHSTKKIDRKISIISIFDGKRDILPNPNPSYYVKEQELGYSYFFGTKKGTSGSGIMTNTGEVIGVNTGNHLYSDKNRKDIHVFVVFNEKIMEFMKQVMGRDYDQLNTKWAYPDFVVRPDEKAVQDFIRICYNPK